jgi:GntR family transcriptional regulator
MQIANTVRSRIATGRYAGKIPSQSELSTEFEASQMTVRKALSILLSDGCLYSIPGKGVFTSQNKPNAELGGAVGFTEQMRRLGAAVTSSVLEARVVPAPTTIAATLRVDVNAPVYRICRVRSVDGEPVAIQTSTIRVEPCPGLLNRDLSTESLFDVFRETYHLVIRGGAGSVEARLADESECRLLHASDPSAVLVTDRVTMVEDGGWSSGGAAFSALPLEYVLSVYRGDRYRLDIGE